MSSDSRIKDAFQAFLIADDSLPCIDALSLVQSLLGKDPRHDGYGQFRDSLLKHLPFKAKQVFAVLDKRLQLNKSLIKESKKSIVISGAGPCGLRACVETALLGHKVTLIELRQECSRHNILKTWQNTLDDLSSLGLTYFVSGVQKHGQLHLGTRNIQVALLKAALLLGAQIEFGRGVCGVLGPSLQLGNSADQGWRVWTLPSDSARQYLGQSSSILQELALKPSETDTSRLQQSSKVDFYEKAESQDSAVFNDKAQLSVEQLDMLSKAEQYQFDALIVAEGESSKLIRRLGFDRKVAKYGEAIGIVINLEFSKDHYTSGEKQLPEFIVWRSSADWKQTVLGTLYTAGIELENLEYMRGSTHFIAGTTNLKALHEFGIINEIRSKVSETLTGDNMNFDKLRIMGRQIANACKVPSHAQFAKKNGVQVFDFSCKGLCVDSFQWLTNTPTKEGDLSQYALICPAGDALQNPFWPQGLGINRGFHNALDAVWVSHLWITGEDQDKIAEERNFAFKLLNWKVFSVDQIQPGEKWTADPITRYSGALVKSVHMHDVESKAVKSSLPRRYLEFYGLKF
ncbi:hypothetical protein MIR68_009374 [Amoeboaphelidium protococcarum]|nr:hypothetical protein MIR68_009374 [Amoeboaphelidium protococcarum]